MRAEKVRHYVLLVGTPRLYLLLVLPTFLVRVLLQVLLTFLVPPARRAVVGPICPPTNETIIGGLASAAWCPSSCAASSSTSSTSFRRVSLLFFSSYSFGDVVLGFIVALNLRV